jgi:isopentenyl-diphosphate delta-isomerase type 2
VSTPSNSQGDLQERKKKHVEICVEADTYTVETGPSAGFEGLRFLHSALPELSADEIDTQTEFLGHTISLPVFISCMTGGSSEGFAANRNLALAAQQARLPVGLGSIRVVFHHEEVFDHFHIKPLAPDVPVMANIGSVQVRDMPHARLLEMCRRLEVQALVVHLNPGQELFQPDGDRDFRGLTEAIERLCDNAPLPVIVKETGFGVGPDTARRLIDAGARYVDVAGAGGTNWVAVESYRLAPTEAKVAREFDRWGLPTAVLLASLRGLQDRVLASGGLRTGLDAAKSVALGAVAAGYALPFIRAVVAGGTDGALAEIERIAMGLRAAMLLAGCPDVSALRHAPLLSEPAFDEEVQALERAVASRGSR